MSKTNITSRIPGFHSMSIEARLARLAELTDLDAAAVDQLSDTGNLRPETADRMIENVIGTMNIPVGVATNLIVDGREVLVPMATEESSVVAAVCNAAKQCRSAGGIATSSSGPLMIAQVQLVGVSDPENARFKILERRSSQSATRPTPFC